MDVELGAGISLAFGCLCDSCDNGFGNSGNMVTSRRSITFALTVLAALMRVSISTAQTPEPILESADIHYTAPTPGQRDIQLFANHPTEALPDSIEFADTPALAGDFGSTERLVLDGDQLHDSGPVRLVRRLWNDQLNFYAPDSLLVLGIGLGVGAAVANTQLDGDIQRHLQSSLHHANSDDWLEGLHANKELGDGRFTLPIYASAWAIGSLFPDAPLANGSRIWGGRTIRGFLVGAPPVLLLQRVTGGFAAG